MTLGIVTFFNLLLSFSCSCYEMLTLRFLLLSCSLVLVARVELAVLVLKDWSTTPGKIINLRLSSVGTLGRVFDADLCRD